MKKYLLDILNNCDCLAHIIKVHRLCRFNNKIGALVKSYNMCYMA